MKRGSNAISSVRKGGSAIHKIYKGSTLVYTSGMLPSKYQQVEYIEVTGTQYIDTGYMLKGNLKVYGKVYTSVQRKEMAVVGTEAEGIEIGFSSTNNRFFVFSHNSVGVAPETSIYNTIVEFTACVTNKPSKELILHNIDGGVKDSSTATNYPYGDNVKLNLFQYNNRMYFYGRLYQFQIYDDDKLVRNFIPCYRKSDNTIGLYDVVNNRFYTNAGKGMFLKGNDMFTI